MDLYSKAKSLNVELNQLLGAYDLLNFLYVHKFLYRPMKKPYIIVTRIFLKQFLLMSLLGQLMGRVSKLNSLDEL
tara:strand:+ start:66 stop:290 length:225 start_codon:yes stop_codon:yes gene_type:complete